VLGNTFDWPNSNGVNVIPGKVTLLKLLKYVHKYKA